jgi:predicted metal-dependent RNase
MRKQEVIKLCEDAKKHLITRMCDLCEDGNQLDAVAIHEEIKEWLAKKENETVLTMKRVHKT